VAQKLGIQPGMLVQSIGQDEDSDQQLLDDVLATAGDELVPEDSDDVVDVVLLWWRDGDGDLVDALVDARRNLDEGGAIWVLVPKSGREAHVPASDIQEAGPTAGLNQTSTVSAAPEWTGVRLVAPKTARTRR
jgi:hypothetical protein